MNSYKGVEAALILSFSTRWRRVVSFTLWLLYHHERTLIFIE